MNLSMKSVVWFSLVVWWGFAYLSYILPNSIIFHLLNPISIAIGILLILVYGRGLMDALYNHNQITPAHLLTFGVTINWSGMIWRMARWYITGEHPAVSSEIDFWVYNIGLFTSIWAGLFLLGAAKLVEGTKFRGSTLAVIFFLIFCSLLYVEEYIWPGHVFSLTPV